MVESDDSAYLYKVEEDRVGVPVKGGLYEVCNLFPNMLYHDQNESCMDHWEAFYPLSLTALSMLSSELVFP